MDRRLVALAAGAFVVAADGTLVIGVLPEIARGLGVSLAAAGQTVTVFAAVYALGGPAFATVLRQISARDVVAGSLVVFAASNVLTAAASNLPVLLVGRALAAVAAALFMPAASVAATMFSSEARRGRALSVVVSGGAAGIAFGVPAGAWIATSSSWRVAFFLLALLAVGVLVANTLLIPTLEPAALPRQKRWEPRTLPVLLVTWMWAFGSFTFFTYVARVLQRAAGVGGGALALFLLLYGVAGIGGSAAAGWLTDRAGARATLRTAFSLLALSLAGLGLLASRAGDDVFAVSACAVLFAGYAAGTWSVTPPQQHRLVALGGDRLVVLALNASALYAGVALGGVAGGIIIGFGHGTGILCWLAAAIELAALAILQVTDPGAAGKARRLRIVARRLERAEKSCHR